MNDIHIEYQSCLKYYCLYLLKQWQSRFFVTVHNGCYYEGTKEMPIDTIYMHLLSDLLLLFYNKERTILFQCSSYLEEAIARPASLLQCNSSCISTAHLLDSREALLPLFSQNNGLNFLNKIIG